MSLAGPIITAVAALGSAAIQTNQARKISEQQKKEVEQLQTESLVKEQARKEQEAKEQAVREKEEESAKKRVGSRLSLISTSPLGLLGGSSVGRRKLLGN